MRLEPEAVARLEGSSPSRKAEDSFQRFYIDNVGAVLGLVIALHRDRGSSEEITQEAFGSAA